MVLGQSLLSSMHAVAALVCFGLLLVTLPQHDRTGAWPVIGFLLAVVVWTGATALALGSASPSRRLFWYHVGYLGPTLGSLSLFVFATEYADRRTLSRPRVVGAVSLVPALTNVLVWTNGFHGLVHAPSVRVVAPPDSLVVLAFEYGPWQYVHAGYAVVLLAAAVAFFLDRARTSETSTGRRQSVAMAFAIVPGLVGVLGYHLGMTRLHWGPLGFAAGAVIVFGAVAVFS